MAMILTNNSPSAGYVAWSGVIMTFKSIDYNIVNGNSNKKFIWWDFTNPNALQTSDTLPTLTDDDCVFLLNIAGVHYLIPGSTEFRAELVYPITVLVPSGVIVMWSGSIATIPTGWLLCDGTNGTPDLRDKFIIGAGSTYAVAITGGEVTHTLSAAEMPVHNHIQDAHTHTQNSHNHIQDAHGHIQNSHNHTQDAHNHTQNAHVHSGAASLGSQHPFTAGDPHQTQLVTNTDTGSTTAINQAATATNQAATPTNQVAAATNQAAIAANQAAIAANQAAGSGGAHNNLPPYYSLAFIQKS